MLVEIRFDYDPRAVEAIKSLPKPSRRWKPDDKVWTVDAREVLRLADLIQPILPELAKELREGDEYKAARDEIEKAKRSLEKSRAVRTDVEIPKPDGEEYLPFQKAGIAFALNVFGDM
jgi:hypothetical protein